MKNWQRRLSAYTWLAVIVIVTAQLLATTWWVAELFAHFTLHGAVLIFLSVMFFRSRFRYALLLFSLAIITWSVLPLSYWTAPKPPPSAQKILLYNVAINNPDPRAEIAFIEQTDADLLLLIEAGGQWQNHLQKLTPRYPQGCGYEEDSPFALKALSKKPLKHCQVKQLNGFPYIRLQTTSDHVVYALHPPPPISAELAEQRNDYLATVAQAIRRETAPTLAVGDLNNTAYSPLYRRFLQQADLQNQTYRALPTWQPFFLPIDHVMSRQTTANAIHVRPLAWQHSDHRPLLIRW